MHCLLQGHYLKSGTTNENALVELLREMRLKEKAQREAAARQPVEVVADGQLLVITKNFKIPASPHAGKPTQLYPLESEADVAMPFGEYMGYSTRTIGSEAFEFFDQLQVGDAEVKGYTE